AGARRWHAVVAGAAAVTTGVLVWTFIGSGALAPTAAWAAVPSPASDAMAARLAGACETQVAQGRTPIQLGQVRAVLAEQRGVSPAVLLLADGHDAICVDPHGRSTEPFGGISGPLVGVTTEDANPDPVLTVDSTPGGPGLGLWAVFGRVGAPGVAKVMVTL